MWYAVLMRWMYHNSVRNSIHFWTSYLDFCNCAPFSLGTLKIDGCSWYDAKSNLLNRSQPGSSTQTTAGKATTTTATKTVTTRTITNYLKWTTFPSIYIPNSFNEGIVYTFACKILPSAKMCPSFWYLSFRFHLVYLSNCHVFFWILPDFGKAIKKIGDSSPNFRESLVHNPQQLDRLLPRLLAGSFGPETSDPFSSSDSEFIWTLYPSIRQR